MYYKTKNFGPKCKTRVSASNSSFGSNAKMSQFATNIFLTFYQFSGSLSLTIKCLEFVVSTGYQNYKSLDFLHFEVDDENNVK